MRLSLQTRSIHHDYVFVGRRHVKRWWKAGTFAEVFSIESPAIAIQRDGSKLYVLLSGIPSDRRDSHDTPIRFSLLVESDHSERDELWNVISVWLEGCRLGSAEESPLARAMQATFPQDTVEEWFREGAVLGEDESDGDLAVQIDHSLSELLRGLPGSELDGTRRDALPMRWLGGLEDQPSRQAFLAEVWSVLDGGGGGREAIAVVAPPRIERRELIETLEGRPELVGGRLAILINDDRGVESLRPKAQRPEAPLPAAKTTPSISSRYSLDRSGLTVLALVALAVLAIILASRERSHGARR